jgi:hypothetical protein
MQKNTFKKITSPVEILRKISFGIITTFIATFLFGLFVPLSQTFAQVSLVKLTTNPPTTTTTSGQTTVKTVNIKPGQPIQITATVSDPQIQIISFFTAGDGKSYSFIPKATKGDGGACQISKQTMSCNTTFGSNDWGTFRINVLPYKNSTDFFKNDPLLYQVNGKTVDNEGIDVIVKEPDFIKVTPDTPKVNTDTTYTPLAPLPGLGNATCKDIKGNDVACIQTSPGCQFDENGNVKPGTCTNPCPFGNYLNIIIKIIIGFAAVLAMVMIVAGGIEYMTSEVISGKEAGKETITHAILGLLLALGAFLILNTINPQLLNACLNNLPKAEIVINEAPPTGADFNPTTGPIPTGAVRSCTEGITKINTSGGSFVVCNRIANSVQSLINKAWTEGYKISGWGWRSYDTQIALRTKNGCPDIYHTPPNCKIPTAIPGTSLHESGLALDFTCDSVAIQTKDNKCFLWLQKNVGGLLKNYSAEPWHWSITGN